MQVFSSLASFVLGRNITSIFGEMLTKFSVVEIRRQLENKIIFFLTATKQVDVA